jgi:hypothetical protein
VRFFGGDKVIWVACPGRGLRWGLTPVRIKGMEPSVLVITAGCN